MSTSFCAVTLLLTTTAFPQTPALNADTLRIRALVAQINTTRQRSDAQAFAQLFTFDGDLRRGSTVLATGPRAIEKYAAERTVWSESTPPQLEDVHLRLVSPEVALVDAVETRIGSVPLKEQAAVMLVLLRIKGEWRIASYRVLADIASAFPPI